MIGLLAAIALQAAPVAMPDKTPTDRWVVCLLTQADRLEPSGEPASAIGDVALAGCLQQQNVFQAATRAEIAANPDRELSTYADQGSRDIVSDLRTNFKALVMERVMTIRARRAAN